VKFSTVAWQNSAVSEFVKLSSNFFAVSNFSFGAESLVKATPDGNFINVLHENFSYKFFAKAKT